MNKVCIQSQTFMNLFGTLFGNTEQGFLNPAGIEPWA